MVSLSSDPLPSRLTWHSSLLLEWDNANFLQRQTALYSGNWDNQIIASLASSLDLIVTCVTLKTSPSFSSLLRFWCYFLLTVVVCYVYVSPADVSVMWHVPAVPQMQEALFIQFRGKKQKQQKRTTSLQFRKLASTGTTLSEILEFSALKWQPNLSSWGCSSASLTSQWHSNVTAGLPNNSDEDLRGWAEELRLRKNETPAADLRASAGSLHIIKARGCFQWLRLRPSPHRLHQAPHTLIYLRCRSKCLPPPGEMGADEIYACMSGNSFFWGGGKNVQFIWGEKSASRCRLMSQTTQRHRSTSGRHNRWWMLTVTLSLNIPRYRWVLCSVIVLFNLISALQPRLHALICCLSLS